MSADVCTSTVDHWRTLLQHQCLVHRWRTFQYRIRFCHPHSTDPLYLELAITDEEKDHDIGYLRSRLFVSTPGVHYVETLFVYSQECQNIESTHRVDRQKPK